MCGCGCELAANRELLKSSLGTSSAGETGAGTLPVNEDWRGWWAEFVDLLHELAPASAQRLPSQPLRAPTSGGAQ